MKPVAHSSKAADTERFEREVGIWKPTAKEKGQPLQASPQDIPNPTTNWTPNPVTQEDSTP